MTYRRNYPRTVAEVLDDGAKYPGAVLRAVKAFRRCKPWRGPLERRITYFRTLCADLARAYGIPEPRLVFADLESGSFSGFSSYQPATHTITLHGKLSVVTFLHEFAHARGADERQAVRWSVNLFRRCFPRSFARCRHEGHCLINDRNER
jgi:hypothetical protein